MIRNTSRIILVLLLLVLMVGGISTLSVSANANHEDEGSFALVGRISNIKITNFDLTQINISLHVDVYNPNSIDVTYQAPTACGFDILTTSSGENGNNNAKFTDTCFNSTTFVFQPGLNQQNIFLGRINLQNWPINSTNTQNINDLPLARYQLSMYHPTFNMTSYGATIDYSGTGQFAISYDKNPYNFWGIGGEGYTTVLPNSFSRISVFSTSQNVTTSQSGGPDLGILVLAVAIISGILIVFAYVSRAKDGTLHNPNIKLKKLSTNNQGTFQKVVMDNTCPVCGSTITAREIFCSNCGNRI